MQPATAFGAASRRTCSVQLLRMASTAAKETPAAPLFVTEFKSAWWALARRFVVTDQRRLFMWESRRRPYAISSEAPLEFKWYSVLPNCPCDSIKLIFSWTLLNFKLKMTLMFRESRCTQKRLWAIEDTCELSTSIIQLLLKITESTPNKNFCNSNGKINFFVKNIYIELVWRLNSLNKLGVMTIPMSWTSTISCFIWSPISCLIVS